MNCINLRNTFGKRYRIEYDPAHRGRADDAWLQIIPCRHGHIYPHSAELLAVATDKRGPIAAAIARLPGVTVLQMGDDGINAAFPLTMLPAVARIIRPKRTRQMTAKQRAAAVERLAKHRFSPARNDAGAA